MKILGRRRQIANLDIILCAKLQKSLKSCTGMFRALTFVSMRKEQNDAARSLPFRLRTDDKLIDHHLGAIHEIAELCFPEAEHVRIVHRISVVEPQNGSFGKHAVINAKTGLALLQVRQGNEPVPSNRIKKNRLPLTEGSPPAILSRKTHRCTFNKQRPERQRFAKRPIVDARSVLLKAPLHEKPPHLWLNVKAF